MAVRRLKSGRFVIEFQQSGARIFRRLHPTATREDAKNLEAKLRRDVFTEASLGVKPDIPLAGVIQLWLENVAVHQKDHHRASLRAKTWAKFVEGRSLLEAPEAAKEAIAEWSGASSVRDAAPAGPKAGNAWNFVPTPATINRRLALLKASLKWAWRQGMTDENLSARVAMLKEFGSRQIYLSRRQAQSLASSAPSSSSRDAIYLLCYTGLRVSELLALPRQSTRTLSLLVAQSKTGKPRIVPVPSTARSYLRARALPLERSYWQLHSEFLAARKKAGLPHVRIHDLRHTCASWLINQGVDLYTVGKILGHSSTQTTARYAHLADKTLRRAMAKLR